jgi:hypothetical protein
MKSLGLHPIAYFYTRGGEFQPAMFIATAAFVRSLVEKKQLPRFTQVRAKVEEFLLEHKDFITLIVKKTGAKSKSHGRIVRYLEKLVDEFASGKANDEVLASLESDEEFKFLVASMSVPPVRDGDNPSRRFNRTTKSASFIEAAILGAVRCGICGSLVHINSMQIDHIEEAHKGGRTDTKNAQVTHPYCNSAKSILRKFSAEVV